MFVCCCLVFSLLHLFTEHPSLAMRSVLAVPESEHEAPLISLLRALVIAGLLLALGIRCGHKFS